MLKVDSWTWLGELADKLKAPTYREAGASKARLVYISPLRGVKLETRA